MITAGSTVILKKNKGGYILVRTRRDGMLVLKKCNVREPAESPARFGPEEVHAPDVVQMAIPPRAA